MRNRRNPKRHKKQKTKFSIRIGVLITVLILIVAAAGILMFPAFNVTEVYCEGNINISSDELLNTANISVGKNTFLENVSGAERKISKIPMIEEVSVERIFPDKICISVVERTPAFYAIMGDASVILDINAVVVKELDAGATAKLLELNQPRLETENKENEEIDEQQPENEEVYLKIPVVAGIELSDAKLGREADSKNKSKFDELFKLCRALNDAGILGKCTYIDITNVSDIIIMAENRLEVHFGTTENVEYRTKFLAEVINTKLSAYEKAIMDYTGDDIYVRPPDDGKDKVTPKPEEKPEPEQEAEEEQSEEQVEDSTADISL